MMKVIYCVNLRHIVYHAYILNLELTFIVMSEYLATTAARPMIGSGEVHDMGGVLLPSIFGSLLLARDSQTTLSMGSIHKQKLHS